MQRQPSLDVVERISWLGTLRGELRALSGRAYRLRGERLEPVVLTTRAHTALPLDDGSALLGGPSASIVRLPASE